MASSTFLNSGLFALFALATLAHGSALGGSSTDIARAALNARHGLPIEAIHRVGRVSIPHRTRQVISDEEDEDEFDVLHHLSGDSPYFNSPGVGLTAAVPDGCSVTRATYLIRHGDIYGNDYEYENIISPFLQKLGNYSDKSAFTADSSLAFLANWTSPITDPEEQLEKVTEMGKQDAGALGALIAQRYEGILKTNRSQPFKVWAGEATRDQDTAKAFINGMNASLSEATLVIVDEGKSQAANTLTPHSSCDEFDPAGGSEEEETFINVYGPKVAARLNGLAASSFNWTAMDVFAAQALCGYDTISRNGTLSGFCHLFTENEWLSFEYANDLMYHRSLGYGNELAPILGMPWLSASTRLLAGTANATSANSSAGAQSLFISFTHREEPPFIVTALGLFNESNSSMPTTSINYERSWKTSQILPFLANVALEALSCNATATGTGPNSTATEINGNTTESSFVRVLVNSAAIPIPGCASGPSGSCPMKNFTSFIADRTSKYGDFVGACKLNTTNATNTLGIYEGVYPANGAAIQTEDIKSNGSTTNGSSGASTNTASNGKNSAVEMKYELTTLLAVIFVALATLVW